MYQLPPGFLAARLKMGVDYEFDIKKISET
jgi:hypothetical protein